MSEKMKVKHKYQHQYHRRYCHRNNKEVFNNEYLK